MELKKIGKIDEASVSFSLAHNKTQSNEIMPSFVIFGGVDKTQYIGDLMKLSSHSKQFWSPAMRGFTYGGVYIAKF